VHQFTIWVQCVNFSMRLHNRKVEGTWPWLPIDLIYSVYPPLPTIDPTEINGDLMTGTIRLFRAHSLAEYNDFFPRCFSSLVWLLVFGEHMRRILNSATFGPEISTSIQVSIGRAAPGDDRNDATQMNHDQFWWWCGGCRSPAKAIVYWAKLRRVFVTRIQLFVALVYFWTLVSIIGLIRTWQ